MVDWLSSNTFTDGEEGVFSDLVNSLLDWGDPYFVLADYRAYVEAQEKADSIYADTEQWSAMAIRNVARSGKFSSDRTIREYAGGIWNLEPIPVEQ